jgi:hypothetical protein
MYIMGRLTNRDHLAEAMITICTLAVSIVQTRDPLGDFVSGEAVELDDHSILPKLRRDHLHRGVAILELDECPTAMHAGFAAPLRIRKKMTTVSFDSVERSYAHFVVIAVG